jgi:hypothetical protein
LTAAWAEDGMVSFWKWYIDELMGEETIVCSCGLLLYTSTHARGLSGTKFAFGKPTGLSKQMKLKGIGYM